MSRLITVGQNHLARMHANSLAEHTINSARTNIASNKYKTPISILKPPDWTTDTDHKMQKNDVTSLNVQPLILKLYGEKTIFYQGPTLWNKLPKHLKETTSASIFKSKLRKYIIENY